MHYLYEIRRATSVGNLSIFGFGDGLEDGHDGDGVLQDTDAFAIFCKDGWGDWVKRDVVVLDYEGNVTYANELYHGPMAGGGFIGDGERSTPISPHIGHTMVRNMISAATSITETNLIQNVDVRYRDFAFESWRRSFALDQQG